MSGKDAGDVITHAAGEGHGRPSPAPLLLLIVAVIFSSTGTAFAAGLLDGTANVSQANPTGRMTAPPAAAANKQFESKSKLSWGKQGAAVGAPAFPVLQKEQPPTAEETAAGRGMESMLVNLMIQEMRKSVPENELVPMTQGEKIFGQMLDDEYAQRISESGTLGIADQVVAQMRGKR